MVLAIWRKRAFLSAKMAAIALISWGSCPQPLHSSPSIHPSTTTLFKALIFSISSSCEGNALISTIKYFAPRWRGRDANTPTYMSRTRSPRSIDNHQDGSRLQLIRCGDVTSQASSSPCRQDQHHRDARAHARGSDDVQKAAPKPARRPRGPVKCLWPRVMAQPL